MAGDHEQVPIDLHTAAALGDFDVVRDCLKDQVYYHGDYHNGEIGSTMSVDSPVRRRSM